MAAKETAVNQTIPSPNPWGRIHYGVYPGQILLSTKLGNGKSRDRKISKKAGKEIKGEMF